MKVAKIFSSFSGEDSFQLVLFSKDGHYGVASIINQTATAVDYSSYEMELAALSTFKGNELSIIDWVPYEVAKTRFANMLNNWLASDMNDQIFAPIKMQPALTLVEKL